MRHHGHDEEVIIKIQCCCKDHQPPTPPEPHEWEAPIVITEPGIYHNIRPYSDDTNTHAVDIQTDGPVTFVNPFTKAAGTHFYSKANSDIRILNGRAIGIKPTIENKTKGRYIYSENWRNIIVKNCSLYHTSGIDLRFYAGNGSTRETVNIIQNEVINIDGRDMYDAQLGSGYYRQFIQLNKCLGLVGARIAWNKVINQYGNSLVEDIINFYMAGGSYNSHLLVHDNYLEGSFPLTGEHSGGGIMADASHDVETGDCTMFIEAYKNYLIRTANYGIAVMGGHDNYYHDNEIIYSGKIDGKPVNGKGNNGMQIYNYNHPQNGRTPSSLYYNNRAKNNIVGYVNSDTNKRQDKYFPTYEENGQTYEGCVDCSANNTYIPGDVEAITTELENSKLGEWEARVRAAGLRIGYTPRLSA